ncbi:aminotransferase class I and II [Lysobacter sp. TY2-98]|uniref:HipA family kinase n=1 Tax=Lysobacter sp. TY2-98 TaxID=2290922 RepID=UPI000E206F16|nr:HipA family kinase [Lysobacter sp. TY2-98]AXK72812.1 aminotransferase class I and II [Lysobacter sp. TY2-98]
MLRHITATRYVTPLREGGSMPAIVEGDDFGLYVLKFRGAGQGTRALVAELIAGRIAQALQLPVPELVFVDLDPELARTEPDSEIQHLIRESAGLNVALDYLPGAANFDPVAGLPDADLASRIVWFDSFVSNVDRTARNPNLMVWHRALWMIDHGAALYFHHGWDTQTPDAASAFPMVREHVLLPAASRIMEADADLAPMLDRPLFERVLGEVPDAWLGDTPVATRERYVDYLTTRLERRAAFVEEARRAHG